MSDQVAPLLPTLQYVSLKERELSFEVLSLIPFATAEKFKVVAFDSDNSLLKLAIVHPEQLKQGFYNALQDIGTKINKKVQVYRTDDLSMRTALKQYRSGPAEVAKPIDEGGDPVELEVENETSLPVAVSVPLNERTRITPPVFKLGKTVSTTYLKKIPLEYTKLHRLVCVDFLAPDIYWFLSDADPLEKLTSSISFIERENAIQAQIIQATTSDVDDLIGFYETVMKNEQAEAARKAALPPTPPEPVKAPLPKGMVTPDVQGAIITSEEAKTGLAGIFQKVAQSFSNEKEEVPVTTSEKEPMTPPLPGQISPTPVASAQPAGTAATQHQATAHGEEGEIGKLLAKAVTTLDELKEHIRQGTVPKIVAALVSFAIHEKASDIHVEAFEDEVRVRYREDGQLVDVVKLPADLHAPIVSRIKILSRLRLDETRVPQDGRFDVNFDHAQVDLRVSIMPTVHGEKVVMRILEKSKSVSSLESLGIEGLAYQNLTKAINRPFGICLATGPTGSGKSTSLYAVLNRIATPNVNVVTLEDPVEYEVKGINQSQIRPKIGYSFAEGLRSVLRQDPNIIMVGEIRDGETAIMATQAALTGHLVLSTLHTNDAAGAIPRLSNMGIEPFLITSSLNIAMGQRLVRKICPKCKDSINLPDGVKAQIEQDLATIEKISPAESSRVKRPLVFYQGRGCNECNGKGYQGRVGIYEVMPMTDAIEELTIARASATALQDQAQKEGMITMYQDGLLKVIAGITTLDEVLRETSNK